jgi:N-dimethylarginine dimethylaminohydrolase
MMEEPDVAALLAESEPRTEPARVLMCRPDYYDVVYAINPHMKDAEGRLRKVDRPRARAQWQALRDVYGAIGFAVETIPGDPGLPDMVFAANQTLPFRTRDGKKAVLLSNMHDEQRRSEVPCYEAWFKSRGYEIRSIPRSRAGSFEGQGDLLWHPGRRLLYGAHGFRTTAEALPAIAAEVAAPVVPLDASCRRTAEMLSNDGFQVHRVDTSEFLKSGGSVFCMKMMFD